MNAIQLVLMFGLLVFNLNPAQRLRDSNQAKYRSDSSAIYGAIRLYEIDSNQSPFTTPLESGKAYTICKSIKQLDCDVSLQVLVDKELIYKIPTNDCGIGNQSGYELKLNSLNEVEVGVNESCI
ncbi:hypothetical protein KBD45_03020 [Candidatus Dojkabacteria bacterium]|nr:hypothetical protein [Candidatus Dojkabacteria bacterium]